MTDTRAGFWLQLAVVALTLAVVAPSCLVRHDRRTRRFATMLAIAVAPASVLLPIVGILLVTSEWSQRTALITFTLVPRRARVVARQAAGQRRAVARRAGPVHRRRARRHRDGRARARPHAGRCRVGLLGQHVVSLGTGMISGVALGAALLASAPAIVCQFALPLAWAIAGRLAGLDAVVHWLDPTSSLAPMTEHLMDGTEWARAGTTLALWMVLPLLIGLWRIQRGEIR